MYKKSIRYFGIIKVYLSIRGSNKTVVITIIMIIVDNIDSFRFCGFRSNDSYQTAL